MDWRHYSLNTTCHSVWESERGTGKSGGINNYQCNTKELRWMTGQSRVAHEV